MEAPTVPGPIEHTDHAAAWLRGTFRCEVGPFGARVACLLDWVWHGIHHLNGEFLQRADWANDHGLAVTIYGGMSTYDYRLLTRLVVAAHDLALRVEVQAATHSYLRLAFSPRVRSGHFFERHATIEEAIVQARTP